MITKERPRAADTLEATLGRFRGELTVADAAARAGLPLRDAEVGLRHLAAERSGHLAATEKGEIIYSFPDGLVRPPETRPLRRFGRAVKRVALGVGRFVVRAWVSVVLVGYALIFLALAIAWSMKRDDDNASGAVRFILRIMAEALFWTFHPFSPVYLARQPYWMHEPGYGRRRPQRDQVPFYEKVNRFVFGPQPPAVDPREEEKRLLSEIRRLEGRLTVGDVMRVTGCTREEADRRILRLLVDYDGEVEVTEAGAIVYRWSALRSTASTDRERAVAPVWTETKTVPPLTGNSPGSDLLFGAINGFNLVASSVALANGLTFARIGEIFARAGEPYPTPLPPPDGVPLALGVVPFVFSVGLYLLPLGRWLRRPALRRKVARENGWRALLRETLSETGAKSALTEAELRRLWERAAGSPPSDRELRDATLAAGGDVDVRDDGTVVYTFATLARERNAALEQRRLAPRSEREAGEVVFSSAQPGTGAIEAGEESGEANRQRALGDGKGPRRPI